VPNRSKSLVYSGFWRLDADSLAWRHMSRNAKKLIFSGFDAVAGGKAAIFLENRCFPQFALP
jgi:hypothetical protein